MHSRSPLGLLVRLARLASLARLVSLVSFAGILIGSSGCGSRSAETPSATPSTSPAASASTAGPGRVIGKVNGSGADAIVVLAPADGHELPPPTTSKVMDQSGYQFLPGLLVAQVGQTVQFRNSEDVLHNVRVTEVATDTPVFNVATLAYGAYDHTFERPGFYTVTCDIHSTMRADILVAPSPYTGKTEADGHFTIKDVPAGTYKLTLYAGGEPVVKTVEVKSGTTELNLP